MAMLLGMPDDMINEILHHVIEDEGIPQYVTLRQVYDYRWPVLRRTTPIGYLK